MFKVFMGFIVANTVCMCAHVCVYACVCTLAHINT